MRPRAELIIAAVVLAHGLPEPLDGAAQVTADIAQTLGPEQHQHYGEKFGLQHQPQRRAAEKTQYQEQGRMHRIA